MTFTGDESFAEPLRFTKELRLRRAGDRPLARHTHRPTPADAAQDARSRPRKK